MSSSKIRSCCNCKRYLKHHRACGSAELRVAKTVSRPPHAQCPSPPLERVPWGRVSPRGDVNQDLPGFLSASALHDVIGAGSSHSVLANNHGGSRCLYCSHPVGHTEVEARRSCCSSRCSDRSAVCSMRSVCCLPYVWTTLQDTPSTLLFGSCHLRHVQ